MSPAVTETSSVCNDDFVQDHSRAGRASFAASDRAKAKDGPGRLKWYRWYVLFVLVVVYAFSYLDRQIVVVLAPFLKSSLKITDAQIGLLYGTSFALFYCLFGIPLARIADSWSRVKTLSAGVLFWSLMTTRSGFAQDFSQLGLARIGVGVGEATASPAAISLLGDYFERRLRGTVLALYSVGVYLGAGASLMIGGSIVSFWSSRYPNSALAPFALSGWQASLIVVGLPGLLLACLILLTVREPERGRLEAASKPTHPRPFRNALLELASMFPPISIIRLIALKAGAREVYGNVLVLACTAAVAVIATWSTNSVLSAVRRAVIYRVGSLDITNNLVQWAVMAIAVYACISWFQTIRLSDPEASRLIAGSKTFRMLMVAGAGLAFSMNAVNGFVFVYGTRYLGLTASNGPLLGIIAVITGGLGITLSGFLSDAARRLHPSGRLYLVCLTASLFTVASLVQYNGASRTVFYVAYAAATFFVPMWFGPLTATTQDLVTPRLRGLSFAIYSLGPNILGLGLGPYCVGLVSDATGNLRLGLLLALGSLLPALGALFYAAHTLGPEEAMARTID